MTGKHGRRLVARERRAIRRLAMQAERTKWAYPYWDDDEAYTDEDDAECWRCEGQGWGIRGTDWDNDDPINDDDGEVEECDCCRGSGLGKDCVYW